MGDESRNREGIENAAHGERCDQQSRDRGTRLANRKQQQRHVREEPMDEDCFEEHRCEADLGARVGKNAAEIGHHCRTIKARRRRRHHATEGEQRRDRHDQSERAENCEHAAPAEQVANHARDRGAYEVSREAHRKEPTDRHLALIDRYKIAGESHRHRKYPARHQPCRRHHLLEVVQHQQQVLLAQRVAQCRQERLPPDLPDLQGLRNCRGHEARLAHGGQRHQIHQPGLAEEVSGDAQRGLHQCVWKCVGARKQCSGFYVDGEIARDHGDDGIDCAREQRLRENHEADDFQDGRDG